MSAQADFWALMRSYFTAYLPRQRGASPHTVESARRAWNLLIGWLKAERGVEPRSIGLETVDVAALTGFLDWGEASRGWAAATRNQRLGMIRSFYRYAALMEPCAQAHASALAAIPLKKAPESPFPEWMDEDAVTALLHAPDIGSRLGLRDAFFMSLMYDAAARDCEMLSARLSDVDQARACISLLGKGSKRRIVPISPETACLFGAYSSAYHAGSGGEAPLFFTVRKGAIGSMSDDNASRIIRSHADVARKACPSVPDRVHPHMLRRSRAMHLYKAGMPLAILSEFLGHADPRTTLIYVRADVEMKRDEVNRAAANGYLGVTLGASPMWLADDDIIGKLMRGYL